LAQKAARYFEDHYNCAESVILAGQELLGANRRIPFSVGTTLGAGIARQGMMCGAITGALILVGLAHGRSSPQEKDMYERAMVTAGEILERFRREHGSLACRELVGLDLNDPSERQRFNDDPERRERCKSFVKTAARLLEQTLRPPG